MTKIYLVRYGEYSDQGIAGAFFYERKRQSTIVKFIMIWKIGGGDHWVDDTFRDELPKEAKVVTYYMCI